MELFRQMIYYVRDQQVISNFYSYMSNNLDQFTFFFENGTLVSETFNKDSKFTDRLLTTYFIKQHPIQEQLKVQEHYDSLTYNNMNVKPEDKINYDEYLERTNQN